MANRNTIITDPAITCFESGKFLDTGSNVTANPGMVVKDGFDSTADIAGYERTNAVADSNNKLYVVVDKQVENIYKLGDIDVSEVGVNATFNGAADSASIAADADDLLVVPIKDVNFSEALIAGGQTVAPRALLSLSTTAGLLAVTTNAAQAVAVFDEDESVTTAANTPRLSSVRWK